MSVFESIADMFGIPSAALEGGVVTLLAVAILTMLRIFLSKQKEDVKQADVLGQVVRLAAAAQEQSSLLRATIEDNTAVLVSLKGAIERFIAQMDTMQNKQQITLDGIRGELLGNRKTRIVVKNAAGEIIAELSAVPTTGEDGESYFEVVYDNKKK